MSNESKRTAVLHAFLTLAIPTVLEEFFATILQYVDTAMVGHLGADATAAVSLSSTYNWFFNSMVSAIGMGFLAYIARAIGEKNEYKIRHAAIMAAETAVVMGTILMIVTRCMAPHVPIWMGAEEHIRANGAAYFRIIFTPMIFRALMMILANVIRSTGDTRTPMKIDVLMNVLNIILNATFIYGLRMGVIGAAIATAMSMTVGGILMTAAFLRSPYVRAERKYFSVEPEVLGSVMKIGIPAMLTRMITCLGYIVATRFVSSMPTVIFAAHSIAITAEQLFYIPGYGMQAATSTLIGNSLGEGDIRKEHQVMAVALGLIVLIMSVTGGVLFVGARFMMSVFTSDPQVIAIGTGLLRIVALTEPVYGAAVVMDGIYVGLGRTRIPMVIELIGRWGIRIIGAYILISRMGGGINEYWYCMIADNLSRAVMLGGGILWIVHHERRHSAD